MFNKPEFDTPQPLTTPRDGIPPVFHTEPQLANYISKLAPSHGPIAVDAERASGFRYGQQAYLIQMRREDAGTALIDPQALPDLTDLNAAISSSEWVLHAASQDLPCLREVGLIPSKIFDTELAGRLLNNPRVWLAHLVANELGYELAKEHSAADWSTRPLPQDWLRYAALDVEVLVELRDLLADQLRAAGKWEWAQQEFQSIVDRPPPPPLSEPWRRTSGIHKIRDRRQLAIVQQLWQTRDEVAQASDTAPGRILSDAAIVAAAQAGNRDLGGIKQFQSRVARRRISLWRTAVQRALDLPESNLPSRKAHSTNPVQQRGWRPKDDESATRFEAIKRIVRTRAVELNLPQENLLTPEYQRRLAISLLTPSSDAIAQELQNFGARPWQIENLAEGLAQAMARPQHIIETVPDPLAQ